MRLKPLISKAREPVKIHEAEGCCIGKGKEHKPCEFGNKASFGWAASRVIVSALGFRNEYDGHTLDKSVEQVERLRESPPEKESVTEDTGVEAKLEKRSYTFPNLFQRSRVLTCSVKRKSTL